MAFKHFAPLAALLALAIPARAILAGFPYRMASINPNASVDDGINFSTGNCWTAASNSDGAAVTLQKCLGPGTASQAWTFSAGSPASGAGGVGTITIFGNKCLDVTNGVDQSGTKLQIFTCANGNTNQKWQATGNDQSTFETVQWVGSTRCVDLTGGSQSPGTPLQIWTCIDGNTHQRWVPQYGSPSPPSSDATIRFHTPLQPPSAPELCITNEGGNNDPVLLSECDPHVQPNLNWMYTGGSIKTSDGAHCLDVTNGVDADGTLLQVYECFNGNTNQQWQFNGNFSIQWKGHNKCIDLTNGNVNSGTQLQIFTCFNGNTNQQWEIEPLNV